MIRLLFAGLLAVTHSASAKNFEAVFRSLKTPAKDAQAEVSYADPLYRKLQLAVRTEGGDSVEANGAGRISLKVDLLAWGQREDEKKLKKAYQEFSELVSREGSSHECLYRSLLFTHAHHGLATRKHRRSLEQFYGDEIRLLRRGIGENLFEFKELLKAQELQLENQQKLQEIEEVLGGISSALRSRSETEIDLEAIDFEGFVDVASIRTRALETEPRILEIEKLKRLAAISTLELEIEKKEARQIVDSVELFRWDESRGVDVSYGVQVSLNLPFFNKRRYLKDSVQRQLALNKLRVAERDVLFDTQGLETNFRRKISQYESLRTSDYAKVLRGMKKLLAGSGQNSPLLILQTQVKIEEEQLRRLGLRQAITLDYLEKLFRSGSLARCEGAPFLVRTP